jgi:hypothetical protein
MRYASLHRFSEHSRSDFNEKVIERNGRHLIAERCRPTTAGRFEISELKNFLAVFGLAKAPAL